MNILVIGRSLPDERTEIGKFEYEQFQTLQEHDRTNNYFYGFVDNRSIKVLRKVTKYSNVNIEGYYFPTGGLPKNIYDIIKFLLFKKMYSNIKKYTDIDIVHFHYPILTTNLKINDYLKKNNVKIVVTEHWSKVQNLELTKREEEILNDVVRQSEKIIAVSEQLLTSIQGYCLASKEKSIVLSNMVNSSFSYRPKLNGRDYTFVTIGRLTKAKGNDKVIEAFRLFSKRVPGSKLLIIGDGPDRERLINLVNKYSLQDRVVFEGRLVPEEIVEKLAISDVYVTASEYETFGVPVVESWFTGTPVILPDNHPLSSYVLDSNGKIFSREIKNDLFNQMINIYIKKFENDSIYSEAKNIFSIDVVVDKLVDIYRSMY